jgi:hypothetical protein
VFKALVGKRRDIRSPLQLGCLPFPFPPILHFLVLIYSDLCLLDTFHLPHSETVVLLFLYPPAPPPPLSKFPNSLTSSLILLPMLGRSSTYDWRWRVQSC